MNDETQRPDRFDARRPEGPVYPDDNSVEARDTSTPEARGTRGAGAGAGGVFLLLASAVFVIVIVLLLTGVADLGGDAIQGDDVLDASPLVETPNDP